MDFGDISGAIGDIAGPILSYMGAESANASNRQAAREQMAFQERMANTTYQRAVKDLESAGLNPMMAYGNMHTSNPSGALAAPAQNSFGAAVSSFNESRGTSAEVSKKAAEQENLRSMNEQINAATAREVATAEKLKQDTKTSASQDLLNIGAQEVQKAQARASNAAAARDAAQAKSIMDDNAKKAMMSNIYDVGEAVTGWAKDKVQKLHNAIPNYTIYHNPKGSK